MSPGAVSRIVDLYMYIERIAQLRLFIRVLSMVARGPRVVEAGKAISSMIEFKRPYESIHLV